jgi:hypothetical protein
MAAHLGEACRVLSLPLDVNRLRWHPFGVYTVALGKRTGADGTGWSRRLHVWHPDAEPVGDASPYGVHTHSGLARSHVLAGTLHHHLYAFSPDPDGIWLRRPGGGAALERLDAHVWAPTRAGTTHTLPADRPHGVSKPPGFAVSLFEQAGDGAGQPFTTWQRIDVAAESLLHVGPVDAGDVLREARAVVESALAQVA